MSVLLNEESEFEKQGVRFKIITEDMYENVKDFYWKHFIPEEPMTRSLGLTRSWLIDKFSLDEVFPHKCSIAAVNEAGDILAIRLAQIRSRDQWISWFLDKIFKTIVTSPTLGSWFLGETMGSNSFIIQKLFGALQYDVWRMFDILKCDKIYQAKVVCSARFHGIRGLGTEIVQRAEALAVEMGCTHSYVLVTGIYSQKIFTKLNYQTLTSLNYDEFQDETGELYLKDTREHTSVITCCKKLK